MNIKQSELIQIIESVVRECIKERKDHWIQKAVNPDHKGYCTPMTKATCTPARKALAKRFKKGIDESEMTNEKAESQITPLEDIVRAIVKRGIRDKATIIKLAKKLYQDQVSKKGADHDAVKDMVDSQVDEASYKVVSPNAVDTSKENKALAIQTEPKVNEASYKVVAPKSATDAKEDKARKIQTEPKVNETAYKTQGPSLKTFDDSPQFPDAVNDPENA